MKSSLLRVCDQLIEVAERRVIEYGAETVERLSAIKAAVEGYVFRIYVVGPFSCGKSTLLNRWMGEDFLSTGPAPETGVSTELHYGSEPRMELHPIESAEPIQTLWGLTAENMDIARRRADNGELANIVLFADNPVLKRYSDLCLVDLPGLSSAKKAHEAAIVRFAQESRRVAVFCLPMNAGTIKDDERVFLRKMSAFGSDFKMLLTKADLCPKSDQPAIVSGLSKDIRDVVYRDIPVGVVSQDSIRDFEKMLQGYASEKDRYLLDRFHDEIAQVAEGMSAVLRRVVFHDYRRNADVDDAIRKLEEVAHGLPSVLERVQVDMQGSVAAASGEIVSDVRHAVEQRRSAVSPEQRSAISSDEIAGIIRSTVAYMAPRKLQDMADDAHVDKVLAKEFDVDVEVPDVPVRNVAKPMPGSQGDSSDSVFGSLSGSLTLGTATLLEVAECFPIGGPLIPIAVLVGTALFQRKREQEEKARREAEYSRQVENAVNQTRPLVEKMLSEATDRYMANLRSAAEKRLSEVNDQLKQLRDAAASDQSEWKENQRKCRVELDVISKIMGSLS